ncbi:MAG: Gfo/Idh/MocA family oxidoreductase [Betaproteobacteria bacterium]
MSRIGLAMVGLGPASEPHLKALADLAERVDLRWVVTRSAERAAKFSGRIDRDVSAEERRALRAPTCATPTLGAPTQQAATDRAPMYKVTTDIAAAINDPAVHAVLVLTPPGAHLDVARMAFAAGKHVLVEKPLELATARAQLLATEGRAAGVRVGVVLQHRFRSGSMALRDLLASGRLGKVQAGMVAVPWWRPQAYYDEPGRGTWARDGGGVLLTQAIHTLDLFRSLLEVRRVVAAHVTTTAVHRMETEDFATALLELGGGAPGTLMATTAFFPGRPERIEVIGTLGSAVLEGASLRAAFLDGTTLEALSDARTGAGASIMDFDHGPHRDVIADFLDAVEGGRDPRVTAEEALATQRLIDEILAKSAAAAAPAP